VASLTLWFVSISSQIAGKEEKLFRTGRHGNKLLIGGLKKPIASIARAAGNADISC
jgi:hypothetical protein